jgi:hypothetical protein
MAKLSKSEITKTAQLLSDYEVVVDALDRARKAKYDFGVTISNEKEDSDFLSVTVEKPYIVTALEAQLTLLKAKLASYDIEV